MFRSTFTIHCLVNLPGFLTRNGWKGWKHMVVSRGSVLRFLRERTQKRLIGRYNQNPISIQLLTCSRIRRTTQSHTHGLESPA